MRIVYVFIVHKRQGQGFPRLNTKVKYLVIFWSDKSRIITQPAYVIVNGCLYPLLTCDPQVQQAVFETEIIVQMSTGLNLYFNGELQNDSRNLKNCP